MIFWPGIMGGFMSFLPKTVILALMGSLFVALVVNPVLSARYQTARPPRFASGGGLADSRSKRVYLRLLEWSLDHRTVVLAVCVAMFFGSAFAFGMFGKGVEFFPETEPKRAYANVEMPVGTNLDATDRRIRLIEGVVSEYDDVRFVIAGTGAATGGGFGGGRDRHAPGFRDHGLQTHRRPGAQLLRHHPRGARAAGSHDHRRRGARGKGG